MKRRAAAIELAACAVLLVAGAVGFVACAKRGPPVVLEYAEVVPEGTAGAMPMRWRDASKAPVHVLAPVQAEVAEASAQPDSLGRPALSFTLAAQDAEAFGAWTEARIHKPMALILDGRVTTVATIQTKLPGSGMLEFGESEPSPAELSGLVDRLTRQR